MAAKTADRVASVSVRGSVAGQLVENTFFYRFASAILLEDLAALAELMADLWISEGIPNLGPLWVGREVYAYDMTAGSGFQVTDTTFAGDVGTQVGSTLPNNVTIAIARKTGLRGRSTQGRIFWPALTTAMLASPTEIAPTSATALLTAIRAIDAGILATGWEPVTLSFQHDGVKVTEAVVTLIAEWLVTDFRLDSRRSRLEGRGV